MSPLFAVNALEKAQKVSPQFWLKVAVFLVTLVVAAFLIRAALRMNKLILGIIIVVAVGIVGFNWIYERNEPAILTPVVDAVAPFFPSKGAYEDTQKKEPAKPGLNKNTSLPQPAKK